MKIDLPLETWVDVFMYLSRLQLMQLVPHIKKGGKHPIRSTIGDRQFVSFIQFYLHKCGEVTLGMLEVQSGPKNGHPFVNVYKNYRLGHELPLPLADVPISQNIKDFEEIHLECFNKAVRRFLQELQHNNLLTNVNIRFANKIINHAADGLVRIMTNVMPLLTSIDSITIYGSASSDFQCLFQNKEYSVLAKRMFGSSRLLNIWDCLNFDWYFDWLYTPREDGQPRCLGLHIYPGDGNRKITPFVERIKKDFLEAKQTAINFFVNLYFYGNTNVQSVTLDNGKTQEKLVINRETFGMSISRHPIGASEKWIAGMKEDFVFKDASRKQRKIIIHF